METETEQSGSYGFINGSIKQHQLSHAKAASAQAAKSRGQTSSPMGSFRPMKPGGNTSGAANDDTAFTRVPRPEFSPSPFGSVDSDPDAENHHQLQAKPALRPVPRPQTLEQQQRLGLFKEQRLTPQPQVYLALGNGTFNILSAKPTDKIEYLTVQEAQVALAQVLATPNSQDAIFYGCNKDLFLDNKIRFGRVNGKAAFLIDPACMSQLTQNLAAKHYQVTLDGAEVKLAKTPAPNAPQRAFAKAPGRFTAPQPKPAHTDTHEEDLKYGFKPGIPSPGRTPSPFK